MRIVTFAFACVLTLFSVGAYADDIKVNADLKAVTIYAGGHGSRATLTRTGQINVEPGKHTLVFENMPANLFPDSLRADGKGTAKAILGALSSKVVNNIELVSAREKELHADKKELENKRKIVEAEKFALHKKQAFLDSINGQADERIREEISEFNLNTDQWLAAADAIHNSNDAILKSIIEKDGQIEEINKQIVKIQQDLNQLRTGQKQTREIRLPVEIKSSGRLSVSLDYQIPNVHWRPVYDARLDTASSTLELVQYGSVTQRTGEDWQDIALTLSTAQPSRGAHIPNIQPMWIDLRSNEQKEQMAKRSMLQSAPTAMMAMEESSMDMMGGDNFADAVEMEAEIPVAQINTSGFNAEFIILGAVSVPADGTESKVLIAPFETEHKLETHIRPRLQSAAFLVASTTIKGEAPLLPGPVSLFRDGSYVGQTSVPMLRPGKSHDLSFGIDDQIDVAYKTLKDESGESGMIIKKSKTIERHTITEIQNLRGKDVSVVVMQALPVSKNEDISIDLLKDHSTAGYEKDHDNIKGLIKWTFDLPSKGKKDVKFGWSISWPEDQNITGLR